jgi:cysteine desulfuration protein SufE
MAEYPERLARLIDLLAMTPDRADRIEILINFAGRFQAVPEEVAKRPFPKEHLIPACESQGYVWAKTQNDGTLKFYFAVENPHGISAQAMAVILGETLSGVSPQEVSKLSEDIVYKIFGDELSMGKSMGLMSMVAMVRNFAKRYVAESVDEPSINPDPRSS